MSERGHSDVHDNPMTAARPWNGAYWLALDATLWRQRLSISLPQAGECNAAGPWLPLLVRGRFRPQSMPARTTLNLLV